MNIKFSSVVPTKAGHYLAYFPASDAISLVNICGSGGDDLKIPGASTDFRIWRCLWSEKIEKPRNQLLTK